METFLRLPEEKRNRFLDAAWEEFTHYSFSDASANRIVRKAGIPRGSFYQYFQDKGDLFHYLMEQMQARFTDQYNRILEQAGGDMFRTQLACFDQFASPKREIDPLFRQCLQVMDLNPGLHWQLITAEAPEHRMLDSFLRHMDLSRFPDRETGANALLLTLLALAGAMMAILNRPEEAPIFRKKLLNQLEIVRRGSLKPET